MEQDLSKLDVTQLHPLSPEVISRQATINIGNALLLMLFACFCSVSLVRQFLYRCIGISVAVPVCAYNLSSPKTHVLIVQPVLAFRMWLQV
jgi:hypothetical protein